MTAPLTRCVRCSLAHDESASCVAVAAAYKRGQHRLRVEAMVQRVAERRAA